MIRAICISNEKEVFESPELFYIGTPIVLTEFLDTEDPNYSAKIILDQQENVFFIQFVDNQKTKEFMPKPADTIDDLYFAAWKCVRKANGKLSMEWSQALCKKTNANFVEISKTLNKTIDTGDIVRKFVGYDGKEYDLTDDSKLSELPTTCNLHC